MTELERANPRTPARRSRGRLVDEVTQLWVRVTGRKVDPREAPWLVGPVGDVLGVGASFFDEWAAQHGLRILPPEDSPGLLTRFTALAGPGFDPQVVSPAIAAFYERTTAWELRIVPRWRGLFRPLGWLISRLFSRRLAQLNLPLSSSDVDGGVRSRIVALVDPDSGERRHTGWVRTSGGTGLPLFVGDYGTAIIPGCADPCVRVVFPLPHGNAVIALRPVAQGEGFALVSDGKRFGDPGFYFTVQRPDGLAVRYVRTMKERLEIRTEGEALRAEHRFAVFGLEFLRLEYTITRKPTAAAA